ncbi:hypothetical protein COJ85_05430 [Bacillus sp. AFS076308]|uniref:hypothetical protein n=1 Tax=unclassified Bacillus (in: firmicutes) TaxID=185979 RepID=UPI000BFA9984|nr:MULTISPECIES: hypothetical protein [unclassified Bacillus (in: firmicutes)]PFO07430.1 hypothetical protein COJ85_05430 [Bacillus sp. AFS076308]PGV52057.1 hypothetical protein COD92_11585 [Bacillus sp. AFS037270]
MIESEKGTVFKWRRNPFSFDLAQDTNLVFLIYFVVYYTKHCDLMTVYEEKRMVYDGKAASTRPI